MSILWLALGAAALYASFRFFWYPRPSRRYRYFFYGEAAVVVSAGEAIFPPGGAIPASGRDAELTAYLDRYLGAAQPRMRVLMRMLLFLIEHSTVFFPAPGRGGMRRFSSLSFDQRVAVIEGWETSRWFPRRLVFISLRSLLTLGYFAHPPVLRAAGVSPYAIQSPVCEADLLYPPIGRPRSEVRYRRRDLTPPSDGTPIPLDAPLHADFAARPR